MLSRVKIQDDLHGGSKEPRKGDFALKTFFDINGCMKNISKENKSAGKNIGQMRQFFYNPLRKPKLDIQCLDCVDVDVDSAQGYPTFPYLCLNLFTNNTYFGLKLG